MTRRPIALVCAVAGFTLVGANLLIDAIAWRVYNCSPDPYFPETCLAQEIAYPGIIVACWLVPTYLVARREAIGLFACVFIGLMLWFGILAWGVLSELLIDSPYDNFSGFWVFALVGVIIAVIVIGLLTAAVGYPMQVFIQARRRKRLGRPAAERPARSTGRIVMKGRWLVVVWALILATLATAGVLRYSRGVQEPPGTGGLMVPVVVSKVDIPARTDLDELIKDDQFTIIQIPVSVVLNGAITSVDLLRGKSNRVPILAGEQILVTRIKGV